MPKPYPQTYEVELIQHLPVEQRSFPPPVEDRKAVREDDTVRLAVTVNGSVAQYPWVVIKCINGETFWAETVEAGEVLNLQ